MLDLEQYLSSLQAFRGVARVFAMGDVFRTSTKRNPAKQQDGGGLGPFGSSPWLSPCYCLKAGLETTLTLTIYCLIYSQNDLKEFHSLIELCNPGILGELCMQSHLVWLLNSLPLFHSQWGCLNLYSYSVQFILNLRYSSPVSSCIWTTHYTRTTT